MADLNLAPTRLAPTCTVPQSQIANLTSAMRSDGGYSVLSCRGNNGGGGGGPTTLTPGSTITTRWRFKSLANSHSLKVLYGNFRTNGVGGAPGNNLITVKASIEAMVPGSPNTQTNPREPVLFSGQRWATIDPSAIVISDPNPTTTLAGSFYYVRTCWGPGGAGVPPAAAPVSSPTLSTSTNGGTFPAATTYFVVISYVGVYGETLPSPVASVTTGAGSTNSITVTAPGGVSGSWGYKVYVGTASGGPFYLSVPNPPQPLTTNCICTLPPYTGYPAALSSFFVSSGGAMNGGTNYTGRNTGEGYANGDLVDDTSGSTQAAVTGAYSPLAVLGIVPGKILPSAALVGDSIMAGTGDAGYATNSGGFGWRACENSNVGFIWVPQGGEQAHQFAQLNVCRIRLAATRWCTNAICNYGTNDLALGLAQMQVDILTISQFFILRGQKFFQTTLNPKATSTDGWQTIANQTIVTGNPLTASSAGYARLNFNIWVLSAATIGTTITGETCPYGAANGSNKIFAPSQAFVAGTESVTVNGTVKALTSDYAYTQTITIGMITYVSGITFVTAPANGATVSMGYMALPGLVAACGGASVAGYFDTAITVACDVNGTASTVGEYWLPDTSGGVQDGVSSGSNTSTTLNDSSKSWTQNQWIGYAVYISSGTGQGQVRTVSYNTATQVDFQDGWSITPDSTSHYRIYSGVTQDGTHPTTANHIKMAAAINTTALVAA